jgi:hypothetical protein
MIPKISWNRDYTGGNLIGCFLFGAAIGFMFTTLNTQKYNGNNQLPANIDSHSALHCPASPGLH